MQPLRSPVFSVLSTILFRPFLFPRPKISGKSLRHEWIGDGEFALIPPDQDWLIRVREMPPSDRSVLAESDILVDIIDTHGPSYDLVVVGDVRGEAFEVLSQLPYWARGKTVVARWGEFSKEEADRLRELQVVAALNREFLMDWILGRVVTAMGGEPTSYYPEDGASATRAIQEELVSA